MSTIYNCASLDVIALLLLKGSLDAIYNLLFTSVAILDCPNCVMDINVAPTSLIYSLYLTISSVCPEWLNTIATSFVFILRACKICKL